jgi:hypothetical protein
MMILADIVAGETAAGDVLFLIAVICAVLSTVAAYVTSWAKAAGPLLSAAVAAFSFGLLLQ